MPCSCIPALRRGVWPPRRRDGFPVSVVAARVDRVKMRWNRGYLPFLVWAFFLERHRSAAGRHSPLEREFTGAGPKARLPIAEESPAALQSKEWIDNPENRGVSL